MRFQTSRGNSEGKSQRGQHILTYSNLRAESSIDFKLVALVTQAHQHGLKITIFNL